MATKLNDIMHLGINPEPPEVMHIDLNSAFAMTEQQENPLLRGTPIGVTNRLYRPGTREEVPFSICITSSYEAKAQGIRIGTKWSEAKQIDPRFVMRESDASKYVYVHQILRSIFQSYSPVSYMKSIDEGIIDFKGMRQLLKGRPLEDIGLEIKQRIKEEVGDYFTVNVGIGQNRWLAKVAASFHKPDGLYTIDKENLEVVYAMMDLLDLPYINVRNRLRLNQAGIITPLDFYQAPYWVLFRQVFQSVLGHHWYLKLRGYETEVQFGIKSVGRNYVLEHRTDDPQEIATLLNKASHKISRRLRKNNLSARGLALGLRYVIRAGIGQHDAPYDNSRFGWFQRRMWKSPVRRADQIYRRAMELYKESPQGFTLMGIEMTSYGIEPFKPEQPTLFEDYEVKRERVEDALHKINDRFGEMMIVPATVAKSKNPMKDKIPFGTVRYFD